MNPEAHNAWSGFRRETYDIRKIRIKRYENAAAFITELSDVFVSCARKANIENCDNIVALGPEILCV